MSLSMQKNTSLFLFVIGALCLTSLVGFAHSKDILFIKGKVFCDPCRIEYETKLSESIEGAKVILECKNRTNDALTLSIEGTTDKTGWYKLAVEGDHEDEICEIRALNSGGNSECNDPLPDRVSARVQVTNKDGIQEPDRVANSLGYMKKKASPDCKKLFEDMNYEELGIDPTQKN